MLQYSDLVYDDLEETTELYETHLNSGEGVRTLLQEGFDDPLFCGVKCTDGSKMIGVCTARPGVEAFTYSKEELVKQIDERWGNLRLFTMDMLVVLPEYRKHGIARELVMQIHDRVVERGGQGYVVEAWFKSGESVAPVYDLLGRYYEKTEIVGKYDDFYKDLGKHGLLCPECGSSCNCGAIVFVVEFQGSGI